MMLVGRKGGTNTLFNDAEGEKLGTDTPTPYNKKRYKKHSIKVSKLSKPKSKNLS